MRIRFAAVASAATAILLFSKGAACMRFRSVLLTYKAMSVVLTLATGIFLSSLSASPASAADVSFISPADENGCGVDLLIEADFSVDRNPVGYGDITFTNLETGASYLQRSRHTDTETFDPSTGNWHIVVMGKIWTPLYPGEPGPEGIVQEPGVELLTSGRLEYTLTSEGVLTEFSLDGTYVDLCAELSD